MWVTWPECPPLIGPGSVLLRRGRGARVRAGHRGGTLQSLPPRRHQAGRGERGGELGSFIEFISQEQMARYETIRHSKYSNILNCSNFIYGSCITSCYLNIDISYIKSTHNIVDSTYFERECGWSSLRWINCLDKIIYSTMPWCAQTWQQDMANGWRFLYYIISKTKKIWLKIDYSKK